jgi:hypothetical protein
MKPPSKRSIDVALRKERKRIQKLLTQDRCVFSNIRGRSGVKKEGGWKWEIPGVSNGNTRGIETTQA